MDLLKRPLAPITPEAWAAIDGEARRAIASNLAARKVVDVDGPHGWQLAAVNTGQLQLLKKDPVPGVRTGLRTVQPLVEMRIPFRLRLLDLDTVPRGAAGAPLQPLVEAAEKIARAEDTVLFQGYKEAGITGLVEASPHKPLAIAKPDRYPQIVAEAREVLQRASVNGPYALVLSPRCYTDILQAEINGYPLHEHLRHIVEGPLVRSPAIEGAILLSLRGGDFQLVLGLDFAIGYTSHDRETVELYLTESFAFRVIEPAAAIPLKA